MSSRAISILSLLAILGLVAYLYEAGKKKPKKGSGFTAWQRITNGERWQPAGVQGPAAQGEAVFAPPLAPINP